MNSITFNDIVEKDSVWRKEHAEIKIMNDLLFLSDNEDLQYVFLSIFLFFAIFRMMYMSQRLSANLSI